MNFSENTDHLNDQELVLLYKSTHDKQFVGALYKRYAHLVLGMCIYYFKDKDTARDIVLQIFEKLFEELKKREVENFKAWLTFVVRNYCISELRKIKTREHREKNYRMETNQGAADEEEQDIIHRNEERLKQLERAIKNLAPFQKRCIELFYLKSLSYSQIVIATGLSAHEVKSHIQNGKRNLKLFMNGSK